MPFLFSPDSSAHDLEHQRLQSYGRKVAALPAASGFPNGLVSYLNQNFYSDGTNWLSQQLFTLPLTFNPTGAVVTPLAATTPVTLISGTPENTLKLYVVKAVIRAVTNTTLDVTNNWTLQLFRQDSTGANVSLGTFNTFQTGRVAGSSYINTITVNTALTAVNDAHVFYITATKNAAPGTLTFSPGIMWYQLIGS